AKIEKSLDGAVEAKAAIEAKFEAEKKEREALEAKLNRMGISGTPEAAKRALDLKEFNVVLAANAADRKRAFEPLDEKGFDEYRKAQDHFLRVGKESLSPEEVKTLSVGSDPDGGYFVTPDTGGRIVTK